MNKKTNLPDIPLCCNILRLQSYLLAPDELILFDWLVVKQISFRYKPFHYSQMRVEDETRIKRTRQEAIIAKFKEWGIIDVEVRQNEVTKGQVRYFSVLFNQLSDNSVLEKIISPTALLYIDFRQYLLYHSEQQSLVLNPRKKEEDTDTTDAEEAYQMLNRIYDERRIMFNEGRLTNGVVPDRLKSHTQLQYNKTIAKRLQRLLRRYEGNTIRNSFIAYVDNMLVGKDYVVPTNQMAFFLSYNKEEESFNVFDFYLNKYNLSYSFPNS